MVSNSERQACPFCAISDRRTRYPWILYEDAFTIAFFPDKPATIGHTLIIPRDHIELLWELSLQQSRAIMETARKLALTIQSSLEPDGLNLIQSNGQMAEQSVNHVHVHLVPRYCNDGIGPIWPHDQHISGEDKSDAFKKICDLIEQRK